MKQFIKFSMLCALAAIAASAASAQTATTSPSAGVLTTSSTATSGTTTVKRKPTSATADMVNEAIQRSEVRAAREAQTGKPQQWGSEEPFAYDPTVNRFNASQQ